jgi:signal transduction histidine kinase
MTFKAQSRLIILLTSLASLILIFSNYYSTKVKSGIRSYINGESNYSKGQKDALINLSYYLNTHDNFYWDRYNEALIVPESDNLARHSMLNNEHDSVAYHHFINGRIHPADIGNIIWMFKNFREVKEFKHAVNLWTESEVILTDLKKSAVDFKSTRDRGATDPELKKELDIMISQSNFTLTKLEIDFSRTLSNLARDIERMLNWVNVFLTILIVGSLSAYLMWIIAKLYKSKDELKASYDKVFKLNLELDTFVYSLSHDLRAPLTSLQGLVRIAALETDMVTIKQNINLMDNLLDKQDLFIKDVISLLQRRNLSPQPKHINLKTVIEDAIALNKHHLHNQKVETKIYIKDGAKELYSDIVFIEIIVNNLISNAFKYSDPNKEAPYIKVSVANVENCTVLAVEDNGIGIPKEYHEKIFEMFYILNSNKRGTGLGLYIIKQAAEKLGGTIHVESSVGQGSKFILSLPKLD